MAGVTSYDLVDNLTKHSVMKMKGSTSLHAAREAKG